MGGIQGTKSEPPPAAMPDFSVDHGEIYIYFINRFKQESPMQFRKILVPVDFSEFSDKAVEYALELALKFAADITLLHAIVLFQDDVDEEQRLQEYESLIERREKKIKNQMIKNSQTVSDRGVAVDSVILRGISAADVILDYLDDHPCDLVVMGTHGRTGLKHLLQGSVAEKVVRLAPVPVLTVHRSVKKFRINRLLVPIDFSAYCKEATDFAVFFAQNFGSEIHFLHVIEQEIHPSFYASGVDSIFEIDPGLKERVIKNMKEFLDDQLPGDLRKKFIVLEGKAHKEIVQYAKEKHMNLIVIATHGLTGLDYILLGSTTEKVVRWATCPVLTVKSREATDE